MNEQDLRILERLGSLKVSDVLTDSEFQKLKSVVLNKGEALEQKRTNPEKKKRFNFIISERADVQDNIGAETPQITPKMVKYKLRLAAWEIRETQQWQSKLSAKLLNFDGAVKNNVHFHPYQDPFGLGMSAVQHDAVNKILKMLEVIQVDSMTDQLLVEAEPSEISQILFEIRDLGGLENFLSNRFPDVTYQSMGTSDESYPELLPYEFLSILADIRANFDTDKKSKRKFKYPVFSPEEIRFEYPNIEIDDSVLETLWDFGVIGLRPHGSKMWDIYMSSEEINQILQV